MPGDHFRHLQLVLDLCTCHFRSCSVTVPLAAHIRLTWRRCRIFDFCPVQASGISRHSSHGGLAAAAALCVGRRLQAHARGKGRAASVHVGILLRMMGHQGLKGLVAVHPCVFEFVCDEMKSQQRVHPDMVNLIEQVGRELGIQCVPEMGGALQLGTALDRRCPAKIRVRTPHHKMDFQKRSHFQSRFEDATRQKGLFDGQARNYYDYAFRMFLDEGYSLDVEFVDVAFHSEQAESAALEAESEWKRMLQLYSGNPTAQRAVRGVKFAFFRSMTVMVSDNFLNKLVMQLQTEATYRELTSKDLFILTLCHVRAWQTSTVVQSLFHNDPHMKASQ